MKRGLRQGNVRVIAFIFCKEVLINLERYFVLWSLLAKFKDVFWYLVIHGIGAAGFMIFLYIGRREIGEYNVSSGQVLYRILIKGDNILHERAALISSFISLLMLTPRPRLFSRSKALLTFNFPSFLGSIRKDVLFEIRRVMVPVLDGFLE